MITFTQVEESEAFEVYRWHRDFAQANAAFYPHQAVELDRLIESSSLWSAREDEDYVGIAYAHYDFENSQIELGGLIVAEQERMRGIGTVLAQLALGHLLVAEQPLQIPHTRVVVRFPIANDLPRRFVEQALRFRHARSIALPGSDFPSLPADPDGYVRGEEFELVVPDTIDALAAWADRWGGTLRSGEVAQVDLVPGLTMGDMALALHEISDQGRAQGISMRYLIKAYPMHEHEVGVLAEASRVGDIANAEVGEGVVQGVADESAIKRLADAGVVVQAIAMAAPPEPEEPAEPSRVRTAGTLNFGLRGADPVIQPGDLGDRERGPHYLLVELLGGVTDDSLSRLKTAGAEIVERDPSGLFVVRAEGGERLLRELPIVGLVRPYDTDDTVHGAASMMEENPETSFSASRRPDPRAVSALRSGRGGRRNAGMFEAILHRSEDSVSVAARLDELGAKVISTSSRSLRFVPRKADLEAVANLPGVASVAKSRPARTFHDIARPLVGLASPGGNAPFPFDGVGEIVGVADTGLDDTHPDFQGRIAGIVALGRPGDASDPDGHGTHVAGSVLGSGAASGQKLAGMAPGAQLYFQSILDVNGGLGGLPDPLTPLFQQAYDAGVRVHNNSWGAYIQARYDSMAIETDEFIFEHPDFVAVIAAGNEGSCRPGWQSPPGFVDFPSVGSPGTSKNGITVGASRSSRTSGGYSKLRWQDAWPEEFDAPPIGQEKVSGDDQGLAGFSSRGPCDDMRIKPDLVAPGTDIASARSQLAPLAHFWGAYPNNPRYAFNGGTSMACPIVAGCAALVRQYYRQVAGHEMPSAALVKATLINGSDPLTGADSTAQPQGFPNYHQGFGRVNMATTLPAPGSPAFDLWFADSWQGDPSLRFDRRSARRRWRIHTEADGTLRICLAWTDPPARGLQNQLRMILDDGGANKWIANDRAAAPIRIAAHDPRALLPGNSRVLSRDPQNNVQVIRADLPAGDYTLAIFADSLLEVPQDFALVIAGPGGAMTVGT